MGKFWPPHVDAYKVRLKVTKFSIPYGDREVVVQWTLYRLKFRGSCGYFWNCLSTLMPYDIQIPNVGANVLETAPPAQDDWAQGQNVWRHRYIRSFLLTCSQGSLQEFNSQTANKLHNTTQQRTCENVLLWR